MAKRIHKSARGVTIDFDLLQAQNKDVIAIGNAGMNAAGDRIVKGKVIRRIEDVPEEQRPDPDSAYAQEIEGAVKMVSLKDKVDDLSTIQNKSLPEETVIPPVTEESEKSKKMTKNKAPTRKLIDTD